MNPPEGSCRVRSCVPSCVIIADRVAELIGLDIRRCRMITDNHSIYIRFITRQGVTPSS